MRKKRITFVCTGNTCRSPMAEIILKNKLKLAGLLNDNKLESYPLGALLAIEDLLTEKERAVNFSANVQMTADTILFGILEEKNRWQKL